LIWDVFKSKESLERELEALDLQLKKLETHFDKIRQEIIRLANAYQENTQEYKRLLEKRDKMVRLNKKLQGRFNEISNKLGRKK